MWSHDDVDCRMVAADAVYRQVPIFDGVNEDMDHLNNDSNSMSSSYGIVGGELPSGEIPPEKVFVDLEYVVLLRTSGAGVNHFVQFGRREPRLVKLEVLLIS